MKQKSIFALFLGAILVLTLSSAEVAFADYDVDDYEKYERDYDDEDHDSEHEKDHDKYDDDYDDDDDDDDDKYEKEGRS